MPAHAWYALPHDAYTDDDDDDDDAAAAAASDADGAGAAASTSSSSGHVLQPAAGGGDDGDDGTEGGEHAGMPAAGSLAQHQAEVRAWLAAEAMLGPQKLTAFAVRAEKHPCASCEDPHALPPCFPASLLSRFRNRRNRPAARLA
eukprot:SAG22_NODE_2289_length_2753_cov_11.769028_3_plen_145_part_00